MRDWQIKLSRELEIALVMRRHGHDRAGAVTHQHVIRDPDRHALAVHRIDRERAGEDAGLLFREIRPLEIRFRRDLRAVCFNRPLVVRRSSSLIDERMLRREHHVRRAVERVGPGGENSNRLAADLAGSADALAGTRTSAPSLRPIQFRCSSLMPSGQSRPSSSSIKPLGISGDPQHPLPHRPPDDREIRRPRFCRR